ncbi:hypothetical protein DKAM_0344 [Desulfurococcus amylolyticus 1221n]|uniref:Uncharacterized protein n=1 Tax=Desulfurococcus amylolyticus (strain DSM 18924 / JCM 16383 / VKM B-2413 / 1221n) TaxID=490899 RepID=B8D3I9_DESA1|nr:hypothetical protein [Desulfurococcus amylolyticus]ACL10670.1 hypothetical protein DKAM_0344 [Desulfurococcus amylolyticus 1221n]
MLSGKIKNAIEDFLSKYGEKAFIVLKTAYNISRDPNIDHRLGDFSYKHLVYKLAETGIAYNPANLLKVMEKNYGIIEKSYASKNQTWWRFSDIDAVREVLEKSINPETGDDPRIKLLVIKYRSLEPWNLLSILRKLALKERFNEVDKEVFRKLAFNDLEKIAGIIKEMMYYEEVFSNEIKLLNEILELAELVAGKLEKAYVSSPVNTVARSIEVSWRNDHT